MGATRWAEGAYTAERAWRVGDTAWGWAGAAVGGVGAAGGGVGWEVIEWRLLAKHLRRVKKASVT